MRGHDENPCILCLKGDVHKYYTIGNVCYLWGILNFCSLSNVCSIWHSSVLLIGIVYKAKLELVVVYQMVDTASILYKTSGLNEDLDKWYICI